MAESSISTPLLRQPQTTLSLEDIKNKGGSSVRARDEGFPGFLSPNQVEVFVKFRNEIRKRDEAFRRTVFSFGYEEDEAYALCRWLRARKYDLPAVLKMVETATEMRRLPSKNNFYPDPKDALGVEPSLYISQYPQLYCGNSKNGCPLFISKPGILNVSGIECITTIEGILRYHWYAMNYDFAKRLREQKGKDPNFHRFEVVCIIDLEGLAVSNVGKRPMNIIKSQSEVDSLCFPETLNRFIIINAPSAFSMLWNVIKGWIDARTAEKVEIHSSRKKWEPRLFELIDKKELPSDYGGLSAPTHERLKEENKEPGLSRQYVQAISVCKSATSDVYEIPAKEEGEIFVNTRSLKEGKFTFVAMDGKPVAMSPVMVKHLGKGTEEEEPTRVTFPQKVSGPRKFRFKIECSTGAWSSEHFFIGINVRDPNLKVRSIRKLSPTRKEKATKKPTKAAKSSSTPDISKETREPAQEMRSSSVVISQSPASCIRDEITMSFENDFVSNSVSSSPAATTPVGEKTKSKQQQRNDLRSRDQMVLSLIEKQRKESDGKSPRGRLTPDTRSTVSSSSSATPTFAVIDPQDESARALGWGCGGASTLDGIFSLWRNPN